MNIPALASESTYIEQRKYFHQATKVLSSQSSKIMDYMLSRFSATYHVPSPCHTDTSYQCK